MNSNSTNIAVSGWSGAGSTTITVLLALLFKKKFYPVTQIFRYLDKELGYAKEKALMAKFEQEVQPIVGKAIDQYVDYILINRSNIILESDITSFRLGRHPKFFSIFLKANKKARAERFNSDGRKNKENSVGKRDEVLREEYMKLWDIDYFSEELIDKKHNLVIDNSKVGLAEELEMIVTELSKRRRFVDDYDWEKINKKSKTLLKTMSTGGKEAILEKLEKKELLVKTEDMLQDIVKIFPEEVEQLPEKVQKLFIGI